MVYTIVTLVELQALPLTLNRSMHVMLLGETWNLMVTSEPPLKNVDPDEARKTCRFTTHHKYKNRFHLVFFAKKHLFKKKKIIFQQRSRILLLKKKQTADHIFFMMCFGNASRIHRWEPGLSLHRWACCQSALQNLHRSSQRFDRSLGVKLWKKWESWRAELECSSSKPVRTELVDGCVQY